jgi:predicted ArsR family transcriptional regulator
MALDNEFADGEGLLGLIKRRGPQRISDLATGLGITDEAARQQLARLADRGLVESVASRGAVGRPAREWALTDRGHARFPDRHAELTVQLLDSVRAAFGDGAIDKMIEQREATMLASYGAEIAQLGDLGQRIVRLAEIRSREGYMAEAQRDGDDWILVEQHCPICAAAAACQNFCRSELDVFRSVLGAGVTVERTEHLLAGARRCAYRISAATTVIA